MPKQQTTRKRRVTDSDYRALAEFRYHIRRYLEFSEMAAKAAGIEPKQYELLVALRGLPPEADRTVGALAEQLHIRHHSTVELINRAESNDFVKRVRLGNFVRVDLTKKGERVLERAVQERLKELQTAGPALVKSLQNLTKHK
jgi:DNA-binding MarR family transcriptional regulator